MGDLCDSLRTRVARTTCCPRSRSDTRLEGQPGLRYALTMTRKRTYDREGHAHFVTFSGFRRRRLLDHDRPEKVVLGVRNPQLALRRGECIGFVVTPDRVHAIVPLPDPADQSVPEAVGAAQLRPDQAALPQEPLLVCSARRPVGGRPIGAPRRLPSVLGELGRGGPDRPPSGPGACRVGRACLRLAPELGAVRRAGPDRGRRRRLAGLNPLAASPPGQKVSRPPRDRRGPIARARRPTARVARIPGGPAIPALGRRVVGVAARRVYSPIDRTGA
jgi:hypothetical protein